MTKTLDDLELGTRLHNCLTNARLFTVADIEATSDAELKRIPNFGAKSLKELRELVPYRRQPSVTLDLVMRGIVGDLLRHEVRRIVRQELERHRDILRGGAGFVATISDGEDDE